jgi:hypothetical protein
VLFPDPDGPHITTADPVATVAEHSLSTRKSPYHLVTLRISIIALACPRRPDRSMYQMYLQKAYITSANRLTCVKTGHSARESLDVSFAWRAYRSGILESRSTWEL